jgi:hypothetical protein
MKPYVNNNWTVFTETAYVAEAFVCSENGNYASIYTTGDSAEEANDKLRGVLHELKLMPQTAIKETSGSKEEGRSFNSPRLVPAPS